MATYSNVYNEDIKVFKENIPLPDETKYLKAETLPNGDILILGSYWQPKTYVYKHLDQKYIELDPIPEEIVPSSSLLLGHNVLNITDLHKKKYGLEKNSDYKNSLFFFMTGGYVQPGYSCIIEYDTKQEKIAYFSHTSCFAPECGSGSGKIFSS